MYITVPIATRTESDIDPFSVTVSEQSCSKTPFTLNVISGENRWTYLATISMSDRDFACLKAAVLEADAKRQATKAAALEALKAELEPEQEPEPFTEPDF